MASGGRVTHHLKALLPDPANAVLLVGFQAAGTPGRMLLAGARELRIHGRTVPVRAEVAEIEAFSVHADAGELVDWIRSAECVPERVALNHGEPASTAALAERISRELGLTVVLPHLGEEVLV
jgi:metallo-beta-lactamase family protein